MPPTPDEIQQEAIRQYQAGDRDAAARLSRQALALQPRRADSIYLLAVIDADQRRPQAAIEGFRAACSVEPNNHVFANALGESLLTAGKFDDAIAAFQRAANLKADYERAHYNLGRTLQQKGDWDAAQESLLRALQLNPGNANTLVFLGGVMLVKQQFSDALKYYRLALEVKPNFPEAHYNCASVLRTTGHPQHAIEHLRQCLRLRPQYARAQLLMGQCMVDLGLIPESIACLQAAIALPPHLHEAHRELAQSLTLVGRAEEAGVEYTLALQHKPDDSEAFAARFRLRETVCDWRERSAEVDRLWADAQREAAAGHLAPVTPLFAASLPWTRQQKRSIAENHARILQQKYEPLPTATPPTTTRIKLAYLSRDLFDHPVGHQVQGVFALHDREQFEVHAYSFGPNDRSEFRRRIEQGVECFHEVADDSIPNLARKIRDDGIHLLIDLMGFSGFGRMGVLAQRPAPVQINWLGFPGTLGASFIDYIIGDPVITPGERADGYSEFIVRLPHTYMPTDREQPISTTPPSRAAQGLPENAVVFCCFNTSIKLEPSIFGVWMRILRQVGDSVAWLNVREPSTRENLKREAQSHGVDPARLVFAQRTPSKPDHLARHALADLFLDTHYYNAHVTACDALWAGLPVITCPGDSFASRVGASVVTAAGLPELVVADFGQYETLAARLAKSPDELRLMKQKLAAQRATCPLFDSARFVRNLERALLAIWRNHTAGLPRRSFDIAESST